MHCCLWFRSVFRVRGPWPKCYGYHLSIIYIALLISNRATGLPAPDSMVVYYVI